MLLPAILPAILAALALACLALACLALAAFADPAVPPAPAPIAPVAPRRAADPTLARLAALTVARSPTRLGCVTPAYLALRRAFAETARMRALGAV